MILMQSKVQVISGVLRTKRYAAIAIAGSIMLGAIYYVITMSMLPLHLGSGALADGDAQVHAMLSITLTIAISGLAGVNFALVAFKIKRMRMLARASLNNKISSTPKSPAAAMLGGVFAAFTPGCPACTAPLAVILGAVGGPVDIPNAGAGAQDDICMYTWILHMVGGARTAVKELLQDWLAAARTQDFKDWQIWMPV